MIEIEVRPQQVIEAKKEVKEFDAQKTHNKGDWKGNWKGPLGEVLVDGWLNSFGTLHYEAIPFIKRGWTQPDYLLHTHLGAGKVLAVDLKTTTHYANWTQSPKHDIYVWSQLKGNPNNPHTLVLKGWMGKQKMDALMAEAKKNNWTEQNTQNGCYKVEREMWGKMRTHWCFTDATLESMDDFVDSILAC